MLPRAWRWKGGRKMVTDFNILRSRLEGERKHLVEELEQLKASTRPEEEAAEAIELGRRMALEKLIKDQMAEIDHALHKFEEGTYGLCDSCGQTIDPARLEALPQTNLCLSCKAKNEKGRPSPG